MSYTINEEILENTINCKKNMQCLSDGKSPECKIEMPVGANVAFIKEKGPDSCPYMLSFGYGYICTCPIRHELHKRYGI
jgi:hypothetical protein